MKLESKILTNSQKSYILQYGIKNIDSSILQLNKLDYIYTKSYMLGEKKKKIKIRKNLKYKIIKNITDNVSLVDYNGKPVIQKIITRENHPWNILPSFNDIFKNNKDLFDRTVYYYNLLDKLGIGPKIEEIVVSDNKLIIYMEDLPQRLTPKIIKKRDKDIKNLIKKLHSHNLIHGDLHGGNLMIDKDGNLKIIDLETMFNLDEIYTNPLPKEWIDIGFGGEFNINEFIHNEEEENYKNIPELY